MMEIPLTKGMVALVDDEDFKRVSIHKWQATTQRSGKTYATRRFWKDGKYKRIYMHIEILGQEFGYILIFDPVQLHLGGNETKFKGNFFFLDLCTLFHELTIFHLRKVCQDFFSFYERFF